MKYLFSFLFILFALPLSTLASSEVLKVAVIDWCPQICLTQKDKGFLIDIFDQFAMKEHYAVNYIHLPWSRGIDQVKKGQVDVLLAPSKKEGEGLYFPAEEIGAQQMCFYGKKSLKWQYKGIKSIHSKMIIAAAQDASLVELELFARQNPKLFDFQPINDHSVLVNRILKNQGDVFLYTRKSIVSYLKERKLEGLIESKGCLKAEELYAALRPTDVIWAQALDEKFSRFMRQARKNGAILQIMRHYGFDDWKK